MFTAQNATKAKSYFAVFSQEVFFVMEYIEGGSVATVDPSGKLNKRCARISGSSRWFEGFEWFMCAGSGGALCLAFGVEVLLLPASAAAFIQWCAFFCATGSLRLKPGGSWCGRSWLFFWYPSITTIHPDTFKCFVLKRIRIHDSNNAFDRMHIFRISKANVQDQFFRAPPDSKIQAVCF